MCLKKTEASAEFYATGRKRLTQRWPYCFDNGGDLVENNLIFLKNLPMTYIHFIIFAMIVSEKKVLLSCRSSNKYIPLFVSWLCYSLQVSGYIVPIKFNTCHFDT
jgi:hypothetical protein